MAEDGGRRRRGRLRRFTVDAAPTTPHTVLHQAMSRGSDCLPASARSLAPEKHVFTSNLLVRRDVFEQERFDEGFSGWGWEDVEWAMRVARRFPILHFDNTATHLGLDTAEALMSKYEQSAGNFARVLQAHPEIVARYASFVRPGCCGGCRCAASGGPC
jgi:hypothetical protein